MGLSTSPDTLLGLMRAQQDRQFPTPRVLSVDDFSFCKRRTYGTILIALERGFPAWSLVCGNGVEQTKSGKRASNSIKSEENSTKIHALFAKKGDTANIA